MVICESHHHVLAHWIEKVESGALPASGVTVLHFDAHPDLALPRRPVAADWPADAQALVRQLDIASFQLAAVRIGLVERVTWLRPPWAHQLPDGERQLHLGTIASGALRVDAPEDYWVLDQGYAPTERLRDRRALGLLVLPLLAVSPERRAANRGADLAEFVAGPRILDIDLDGFATHNPAADRLRTLGLPEQDIATVRRIFDPSGLDLAEDPEERVEQVDELLAALELASSGTWIDLPGAAWTLLAAGLGPADLYALYGVLSRDPRGVATRALLQHGRDLVGLPEHRADSAEILRLARALARLAADPASAPLLITIARSVEDGFTPREAWPEIEWTLLLALHEAVGTFPIRMDPGLSAAPRPARLPEGLSWPEAR